MVSAVDGKHAGQASDASSESVNGVAAAGGMVATVEYMQKVSEDQVRLLTASMTAEWESVAKSADAGARPSPLSAKREAYWSEERPPKLKRPQSEQMSPPPRQPDFGR